MPPLELKISGWRLAKCTSSKRVSAQCPAPASKPSNSRFGEELDGRLPTQRRERAVAELVVARPELPAAQVDVGERHLRWCLSVESSVAILTKPSYQSRLATPASSWCRSVAASHFSNLATVHPRSPTSRRYSTGSLSNHAMSTASARRRPRRSPSSDATASTIIAAPSRRWSLEVSNTARGGRVQIGGRLDRDEQFGHPDVDPDEHPRPAVEQGRRIRQAEQCLRPRVGRPTAMGASSPAIAQSSASESSSTLPPTAVKTVLRLTPAAAAIASTVVAPNPVARRVRLRRRRFGGGCPAPASPATPTGNRA